MVDEEMEPQRFANLGQGDMRKRVSMNLRSEEIAVDLWQRHDAAGQRLASILRQVHVGLERGSWSRQQGKPSEGDQVMSLPRTGLVITCGLTPPLRHAADSVRPLHLAAVKD